MANANGMEASMRTAANAPTGASTATANAMPTGATAATANAMPAGALMAAGGFFPKSAEANRCHKDTMFRDLFGSPERKANALELYNALNGTDYDDPDALELTTLGDVIYLNVKNDVSFLLGSEQVLWEHQSSPNPNMPLRGLLYFARIYSAYAEKENLNLYSKKTLRLPTPRYVVFYNGVEERPDRETLRLSSSFESAGSIDVSCEVINVNWGRNNAIAELCPTLEGYSYFVERVRMYNSAEGATLSEAVDGAIGDCIATGRLVAYLTEKRAEVFDMFMTEFDEERQRRLDRRDGFEDGMQQGLVQGLEQGLEQGIEQGFTESIASLMSNTGATAEEAMELLSIPQGERARYAELLSDCR